MPEINGVQISERMQRMIDEKGGVIPGVDEVEMKPTVVQENEKVLDMATPSETVSELGEQEMKEIEVKKRIKEDLALVLGKVPDWARNVPGEPNKYSEYKKTVGEANDRLKEKGINLNEYIYEIDSSLVDEQRNLKMGQNKAELREIVQKMEADEDLSNEQKETADLVGLKPEDLLHSSDEVSEEGGDRSQETPRQRELGRSEVEKKIENINAYPSSALKRAALESYRVSLIRKMSAAADIEKIDRALLQLKQEVETEISEYATRGEMRLELKSAVEKYTEDLERKYDAGSDLVNSYTKTADIELLKSLAEMKKMGSDGELVATDLEKELFAIGVLHELKNKINTRNAVDQTMLDYASMLKGEQLERLIHLEDRTVVNENDATGGRDYVVRCLASIDKEARATYREGSGTKVFKLEDPDLENKVLSEAKGGSLYFKIARDIYRVTGGEARYGVGGLTHQDPEKGNAWTIEKNGDENNGSFIRKALNARREVAGALDPSIEGRFVPRFDQILWRHLDPGFGSFWETLWKKVKDNDSVSDTVKNKFGYQKETPLLRSQDAAAGVFQRDYAELSVESLRSLRFGVREPDSVDLGNEIAFNVWMDNVGKVATGMSNETKFMAKPSFNSFKVFFGDEYKGVFPKNKVDGRKINREEYLEERLSDFVIFLRTNTTFPPTKIAEALREYAAADFVFKSGVQLEKFMDKHKIPKGAVSDVISNAINLKDNLKSGDPVEKRKAQGKALGLGKLFVEFLGQIIKDAGK